MELIKGFYINIDRRLDRKLHFEKLKEKYSFFKGVDRFSAIESDNGSIGCCSSHMAAIKKCKQLDGDVSMICEDDLMIFNDQSFNNMVNTLNLTADWDVLTLTPRGDVILNEDLPNGYIRIKNNQTATAYLFKKHMIDILIETLQYGLDQMKLGGHTDYFTNDQVWKKLQIPYKFYFYKDIFAGQLAGFSDIEKRLVNYNERFINQC
jgi:GR25 family glycosyltransferase involved in LPS biosynthesis|tara:strand:+ start:12262 stop:12882 length:621 start_codon:yes stop_codon:yes gene_type:complete